MPILLDRAEIVELSGSDAAAFAQSQFTSDVSRLSPGQWQWSAWLDPQGRVRHLFALLCVEEGRLLAWLPRGNAGDMASGLSRYQLRSKLTLRAVPDAFLLDAQVDAPAQRVIAVSNDAWTIGIGLANPRPAMLAIGLPAQLVDTARRAAWQLADVDDGLPWISARVADQFTPQALGLERLDAISLGKGCYPGQEIVARLHFRGGNKRGCFRVNIGDGALPDAGTPLVSGNNGAAVGFILYAARIDQASCRALAVLPLDLPADAVVRVEDGPNIVILGKAN